MMSKDIDSEYPRHDIPIPNEAKNYSDTAIANLFGSHINKINSERQTIWQRYFCFLVANSIIVSGFIIKSSDAIFAAKSIQQTASNNEKIDAIINTFLLMFEAIPVGGMILCGTWIYLNYRGWRLYGNAINTSSRFNWIGLPLELNPSNSRKGRGVRNNNLFDSIYWSAQLIPIIFFIFYLFIFCMINRII